MTYPLFEVPHDAPHDEKNKPGAYWFLPIYGPDGEKREIFLETYASPEYKATRIDKIPVRICLPGGDWWDVDGPASNSDSGWSVTGEPPNLTVHPSIGTSTYHGWLKDGVLSDDLEGRTFDKQP
jgi:hypothetical protein